MDRSPRAKALWLFLILIAFGVRAGIPFGYMPRDGQSGALRSGGIFAFCGDLGPQAIDPRLLNSPLAARETGLPGGHDPRKSSDHDRLCAFAGHEAGAAAPLLSAHEPPTRPLAAAIPTFARAGARVERSEKGPPARAPPAI